MVVRLLRTCSITGAIYGGGNFAGQGDAGPLSGGTARTIALHDPHGFCTRPDRSSRPRSRRQIEHWRIFWTCDGRLPTPRMIWGPYSAGSASSNRHFPCIASGADGTGGQVDCRQRFSCGDQGNPWSFDTPVASWPLTIGCCPEELARGWWPFVRRWSNWGFGRTSW